MRLLPTNFLTFAAPVAFAVLAACTRAPASSYETFTAAMNTYLAEHGRLCLAKNVWPIDVTAREADAGSRDALQMPVLEALGLVSSSPASIDVDEDGARQRLAARRYVLTEAGRRYYFSLGPPHAAAVTPAAGDFCAARLSLDRVVDWKVEADPRTQARIATVTYTYRVDAAPWARDARAQQVFPVVAGIMRGAGTARLQERFAQSGSGWVPLDPHDS